MRPAIARAMLNSAVKRGDLSRPPECSRCGRRAKIVGHHEDYSRPLDVLWLCLSCHRAEHERIGWGAPHNGAHEEAKEEARAIRLRMNIATARRMEAARVRAERSEGARLPFVAFARRLIVEALAAREANGST